MEAANRSNAVAEVWSSHCAGSMAKATGTADLRSETVAGAKQYVKGKIVDSAMLARRRRQRHRSLEEGTGLSTTTYKFWIWDK